MKKLMFIMVTLLLTGMSTTTAFAQLQEVKGIETKRIYEKGYYGENKYYWEFTNANNFKVSIDAEVWSPGYDHFGRMYERLVDTKSFLLAPYESYKLEVKYENMTIKFKAYKM